MQSLKRINTNDRIHLDLTILTRPVAPLTEASKTVNESSDQDREVDDLPMADAEAFFLTF